MRSFGSINRYGIQLWGIWQTMSRCHAQVFHQLGIFSIHIAIFMEVVFVEALLNSLAMHLDLALFTTDDLD